VPRSPDFGTRGQFLSESSHPLAIADEGQRHRDQGEAEEAREDHVSLSLGDVRGHDKWEQQQQRRHVKERREKEHYRTGTGVWNLSRAAIVPVDLGESQNEYGEDNGSQNPVIACGKTDREIDYQPRQKKPDQENQSVEENRVSPPKSVEPIHVETSIPPDRQSTFGEESSDSGTFKSGSQLTGLGSPEKKPKTEHHEKCYHDENDVSSGLVGWCGAHDKVQARGNGVCREDHNCEDDERVANEIAVVHA